MLLYSNVLRNHLIHERSSTMCINSGVVFCLKVAISISAQPPGYDDIVLAGIPIRVSDMVRTNSTSIIMVLGP